MEGWQSGRMHRFRKPESSKGDHRFKSCTLRIKTKSKNPVMGFFDLLFLLIYFKYKSKKLAASVAIWVMLGDILVPVNP